MKSGKLKDLLLLFFLTFFMYNVNFRPIPSGDTVPAQLLPFSILREGNLDLNEFGLTRASSPPGSLLYAVFPVQSWQRVPGGREGWITTVKAADGRPQLFLREKEGLLWESTWEVNEWGAWSVIPGEPIRGESRPAAVLDHAGRTHLFVQAKNLAIWENVKERGQWQGWKRVPGGRTLSAPTAVVDEEGIIHLIVQGIVSNLYENRLEGQDWQGWRKLVRGKGKAGPVAVVDAEGRLHVLLYGLDQKVWHFLKDTVPEPEPWQQIPQQPAIVGFTVSLDGQGRVVCIAVDAALTLWQNVFSQGQWNGWRALKPLGPLPPREVVRGEVAGFLDNQGAVWLFATVGRVVRPNLPSFVRQVGTRIMSQYPVALPLVITPLYVPVVWFLPPAWLDFTNPNRNRQAAKIALLLEKLSASLIASLSVLLVYLTLRELCTRQPAFWLSVLYGLGTNTWTIGSQALWQHGFSELSLSLMVYALLKARQREVWLLVAGLGAILATANRPPNVLFAVLALVYIWHVHRWRSWKFLPLLFVLGVFLLVYNLSFFGALMGGYGTVRIGRAFLHANYTGIPGLLLSPNRGLFIYTPFTLFSCWGLVRLWRWRGELLLRYMSVGVLGQLLLYGKFFGWWGGWCFGPRFLTDVTPFFCLLLVPVLPFLQRWLIRGPFLFAALVSVAVQIVGAFFYTAQWDSLPALRKRLWGWRETQILLSVQSGPAPTLYPELVGALQKRSSPDDADVPP